MTSFQAAILGLVQGLTEFLPVSSTAHLLFAQRLMGIEKSNLHLEIAVHLGTLGTVLLYYRKILVSMVADTVRGGPARRLSLLVVVATLPVVAVSKIPGSMILRESAHAATYAGIALVVTGCFLLATMFAKRRPHEPGWLDAVVTGIAQCFAAVFPGVSRSGSTIGAALLCGNDATWATQFSFLLSIPAILGGAYADYKESGLPAHDELVPLSLAAVVGFASGLFAIYAVLKLVARGRLAAFGPYCVAVGVAALIWLT